VVSLSNPVAAGAVAGSDPGEKFRGAVALRMLVLHAYILAEIATGLIFSFVYDGDYGLLAAIFRAFGARRRICSPRPQTSMLAILIVIV